MANEKEVKEVKTTMKIWTSEFNDWSQVLQGRNSAARAQFRLLSKDDLKTIDKATAKGELLAEIARMRIAVDMLEAIAKDVEV